MTERSTRKLTTKRRPNTAKPAQEPHLLFVPHSDKDKLHNVVSSHARRWQLDAKYRHQKSSARQQAVYARSLVGWHGSAPLTDGETTVAASGTGPSYDGNADQGDNQPRVGNGIAHSTHDRIKRDIQKRQSRWRIGRTCLPRQIDPGHRAREIDIVLQQAFNWIQGSFSASWKAQMHGYPYIFDIDRRAEVLRDSFLVVSDLLAMGKTQLAFGALNDILDTIPQYFTNSHPALFLCLVELSFGLNMPQAPAILQKQVKSHVAELARVVLGPRHPITILLSRKFEEGDKFYVTEIVLNCLTDTLATVFGKHGYQTLFYEFAAAQIYAQHGRTIDAEMLMTKVLRAWSDKFGGDTALVGLAEFELGNLRLRSCREPTCPNKIDVFQASLKVEKAFEIWNHSLAMHTREPSAPVIPRWRIDLARHLFHKRIYAVALHLYCCGSFEELCFYNPRAITSTDILLADRLADTLQRAFPTAPT